MTFRIPRFAVALTLCAAFAVQAAEGDPEAGKNKSATCTACHGVDGNSVNGEWPKLAGQHAEYLDRQLHLFKSGGRQNPIMLGMVAALSDEDMADLAAYYAENTVKPGVADPALVATGERVFRAGNPQSGVPACMACHGPAGAGNPLSGYPKLAGQHAVYTASVLRAFRDGTVWGAGDDANAVMAGVASNLTDEEIDAVASYLEGLYDQ